MSEFGRSSQPCHEIAFEKAEQDNSYLDLHLLPVSVNDHQPGSHDKLYSLH